MGEDGDRYFHTIPTSSYVVNCELISQRLLPRSFSHLQACSGNNKPLISPNEMVHERGMALSMIYR